MSFPATRRLVRERRKRPKSWKLQRSGQGTQELTTNPVVGMETKNRRVEVSRLGDRSARMLAGEPMPETMRHAMVAFAVISTPEAGGRVEHGPLFIHITSLDGDSELDV